jgi:hypothetical protein
MSSLATPRINQLCPSSFVVTHPPQAVAEVRAVVKPLPARDNYPSTARNSIRSRAWAAPIQGCSYQVRAWGQALGPLVLCWRCPYGILKWRAGRGGGTSLFQGRETWRVGCWSRMRSALQQDCTALWLGGWSYGRLSVCGSRCGCGLGCGTSAPLGLPGKDLGQAHLAESAGTAWLGGARSAAWLVK